jgi:predicted DNA binding CopG/RHH family protein
MTRDDDTKLDEEILASFERGEWRSGPQAKAEVACFSAIAKASLVKDKRVNIRMSSRDLEDLQARAAREGVPCQTLMTSVLHRFVTGELVEAARPAIRPKRRAS